jgi:serine/threonine protein phosphatase PrpC
VSSSETKTTSRLILDAHMEDVELLEFPAGQIAVFSARSPDRSDRNEDGAAVIPLEGGLVLAVADGLGGVAGGHHASRTTLEVLRDSLEAQSEAGIRERIMTALDQANAAIQESASTGQTTLVVAEIQAGSVRTYNVGDSAAFVVGQRGRIKLRTVAHSPVGYGVEAGLIDETEALHHEERHVVSNTVGSVEMRIEVNSEYTFAVRDTLVMGSDGLFDNLHLDEISEFVRKGPLDEAARELVKACRERMHAPAAGNPSKPDDLTLVVFRPAIE